MASFSPVNFILAFFALFSCLHFTFAAPVDIAARSSRAVEIRDVFVPPIIEPNADSVWTIGTTQVVTWDVTHPPKQITNRLGRIVLRSEETGLLDLANPLAEGFDILIASQNVTVPNVKPGTYQIVLFGNSGNWGESFQIVGDYVPPAESA
ncbi:hypothetical protein E4U55_002051 [Claviceps digitariae]|nr:hypothetical protein E4U55_002051 [Claviceps digitariae]